MRSLLTLTLCVLCLIAAAPSRSAAQNEQGIPKEVRKKFEKAALFPFYDAANDVTSVHMVAVGLTGRWGNSSGAESLLAASLGVRPEGERFSLYFTFPGKVFTPPGKVTLRLVSTSRAVPGLANGQEAEVSINADGAGVTNVKSSVETQKFKTDIPKPNTEYVEQMLDVPLTIEEFRRLAASKRAEVIVEGKSIPLKERHLKALRRVVDAIGGAH
ncbi:MAG TPA: hypothetical protein VF297_16670 [Pyrinomonadaceae bacterium]